MFPDKVRNEKLKKKMITSWIGIGKLFLSLFLKK